MNIKNFTVSGFARFYRSLLRFNRDMSDDYALKLTYGLYASVYDACRLMKPDAGITEHGENDFYAKIKQSDKKSYRTIVQFYRAMEVLIYSMPSKPDILKKCKLSGILEISIMMDTIEMDFLDAFDMEIDDERTIYNMCAKSLIPRRDEPGLCIMQDWIDAVAEKSQSA